MCNRLHIAHCIIASLHHRTYDVPAMNNLTSNKGFWHRRLGLGALRYPIPDAAAAFRYSLGAVTLASFVMLVLTGIWLAQFYNGSPAGAHDSVLYIMVGAPFGDLARSLHYWSATAMVVSIVAHLAWGFRCRAYRAPREMTWYAGVGLAALVFLLVVTGTVLRYDQEGYEALAHFLAGGELTGALGFFFTPDFALSVPMLGRILSLHTSLLPLGVFVLLGLHLWLVRQLGMSAEGPQNVIFGDHLRTITGYCLILLALLVVVSVLAPPGLGHAPVPGYEITKPFWPVLWIYALESLTGMWAVIWAPLLVFLFLAAVPLLDRSAARPTALRIAGAALLLILVALSLWAALTPPQQHLGM
jgi:ubiquinol-cytochrome c reductase cytochrome b subunit